MGNLTTYIDQYGYIVLFLALMLELLALPLPGEVLMSYSGYLVFQGHLNWMLSIIMAGVGASIGMTMSYWIGYRLGTPFFEKHGHRFHMGPKQLDKISNWFNVHGNRLLIIAYFIPGIRHITGYFSGITRISFRVFALFAYSGAFLWVAVFITLGKILGPQWEQFHASIKKYLIIASIVAVIIVVAIYLYKQFKESLQTLAIKILHAVLASFHSQKRVAFLLLSTTIVTAGLLVLMIGMIQDFIGNEFQDFNKVVRLLVSLIFTKEWEGIMGVISLFGSRNVLLSLILCTLIWIVWKGHNKGIELLSLVIVVCGGELYEEGLRMIFHNLSPIHYSSMNQLLYSFPSEQSLMMAVIYGFFVFMIVRHSGKLWMHTSFPIVALLLLTLIAISRLYMQVELPSDIAAGYVFGGVWLGLNILLLEIVRLLQSIDPVKKEKNR